MVTATFRFGFGNSVTKQFSAGTTIAAGADAVRPVLGHGDSVEYAVDGVIVPGSTTVREGMVVVVSQKACEKRA